MTATFIVIKKGQEIKFNSYFQDLESAKSHLHRNMSNNTFAMDLYYNRKLSDKQIAWIHYLATENMKQSQEQSTDGKYIELVSKMYNATKKKTSKFHIHLPGDVSISTVTRGVNAGFLYVFENQVYQGKITPTGHFIGRASDDTLAMLEDANENLLKLAQLYGHETGQCSVCARTLTDAQSIALGIGPICLSRLS